MATQGQWRWCGECETLHFAGHFDGAGQALLTGACPGSPTGRHSVAGSGQYTLVFADARAPGQTGWQWCSRCQGLFFPGTPPAPAGCPGPSGAHDLSGGTYALVLDDESASGQTGWRWCGLCHVLFFGETGSGACAGRPPGRRREGHLVNGGVYTVLLDISESVIVEQNAQILAAHAALLANDPGGAVLYFAGGGYPHPGGSVDTRDINRTRVWRAATGAIDAVPPPPGHDLFCCGQAFLPDGRLLAAGGTAESRRGPQSGAHGHAFHWPGQANASIFDPRADGGRGAWLSTLSMARGRWYPTLVARASAVIAMGGHPDGVSGVHSNTMVEEWREPPGRWSHVGDEPETVVEAIRTDPRGDPFIPGAGPQEGGWPEQYPRLHVLPDGRVLVVRLTGRYGDRTWVMEPLGAQWGWMHLCEAPLDVIPDDGPPSYSSGYFFLGTTVLLPLVGPDYRARVLYVGERQPLVLDMGPQGRGRFVEWTTEGAGIRDWVDRPGNRAPRRHHCNATLLPDGTVLVVGGVDDHRFGDTVVGDVMPAELFDPYLGTWTTLAPLQRPRNYHTSALLLPDGRVWISGSTPHDGPPQLSIETFRPPYLARGPGPRNDLRPTVAFHLGPLTIPTPDADTVTRVTLVKCGSVTHGFNSDQRHVELDVVRRSPTALEVRMPPLHVAPDGWYMLFLLNAIGVPSTGVMVRVAEWAP